MFDVLLNVRDIARSVQFYETLGMVRDVGYGLASGSTSSDPSTVYDALGAGTAHVTQETMLMWPWDPCMHITLREWSDKTIDAGWPKAFHQTGATAHSFLVDSVDDELKTLERLGIKILAPPQLVHRKWGPTTSVWFRDPDGNHVEFLEIEYADAGWDPRRRSVAGAPRTFLHYQINTANPAAMFEFYEGFGFESDIGVDPRPNTDVWELTGDSYERGFGIKIQESVSGARFLRLPTDPSNMHLEIIGWKAETMPVPGPEPKYNQHGIARFCFKVDDYRGGLADFKRRGIRILGDEDQRGWLQWGDSQWFFFADPDGNFLTWEQWHPARTWGERH
jgi:catechol 2,3-dioxygenase-like lactoylglutathione lyase family enzyme